MSGRRWNRVAASIVASASIVLPLSSCGASWEQSPDLNKRGDAVNSTMQALHLSDAQKLADLAGPAPAEPADASSLLDKWGGVSDRDYSVSYKDGLGPSHVTVKVSAASKTGQPVEVQFTMSWHDGRWLLGIGHAVAPTGPTHPAQPGGNLGG